MGLELGKGFGLGLRVGARVRARVSSPPEISRDSRSVEAKTSATRDMEKCSLTKPQSSARSTSSVCSMDSAEPPSSPAA